MAYLKNNDRNLAKVIEVVGECTLRPQKNHFESIIDAIISQQLSMRSAQSIFNRFLSYFNYKSFPEPVDILQTSDDTLKSIGLSRNKIVSIKDLSFKMLKGEIDLEVMDSLSDDEIIKILTRVKGIGVWTVHMFLIFSLFRLNVLPSEDLGIRKGIKKLYGLKKLPDSKKVIQVSKQNKWEPFNSVASWYIWRSLEINI